MNKIRAKERPKTKIMPNPYFRFKQFTIYQDKCAMKVGTDGVLLGAWSDVGSGGKMLDVGTGTGLIALMIAQRSPAGSLWAVENEESALEQAKLNIDNSPFSDRITLVNSSFQLFARQTAIRFDLIVSNPPFFSDSLLPPVKQRAEARHSVTLTLEELLYSCRSCLAESGILSLILPYSRSNELEKLCEKYAFHLKRKTIVYPLRNTTPKRILVELTSKQTSRPVTRSLVIEESRHHYTKDFTELVRDFYLYL